ncbi:hypothetical protein ACQ4PT_072057 [Festuca glaucescens]
MAEDAGDREQQQPAAAAGGGAGPREDGGGREESAVKLFVGQVPKLMTEAELAAMFRDVAIVDEVTVIRDKATKVSRGSSGSVRLPRAAGVSSPPPSQCHYSVSVPACLSLCFFFLAGRDLGAVLREHGSVALRSSRFLAGGPMPPRKLELAGFSLFGQKCFVLGLWELGSFLAV